jgi:hypothetical protein
MHEMGELLDYLGLFPPIRQKLLQLAGVCGRDAGQHAGEVALGVEAMAFGAGDKAIERSGSLGGDIMPCEQPVLSADPDPPQGAFGSVAPTGISHSPSKPL